MHNFSNYAYQSSLLLVSVFVFKSYKSHDRGHTTLSADSEILNASEKNNSDNLLLVR